MRISGTELWLIKFIQLYCKVVTYELHASDLLKGVFYLKVKIVSKI